MPGFTGRQPQPRGKNRAMAQRKTLTEKQVGVLRWIGDGCPDGVMPADNFHRISAAALRSRGYAEVSGKGATWTAKITKEGREYLKQVDSDDPPVPRMANISVSDQLVADIVEADGTLRRTRAGWNYGKRGTDYERRARIAIERGKVPDGKRLTIYHDGRDVVFTLVDAPDYRGGRLPVPQVEVPERVGKYHEIARRFRDDTDRHEVSRGQVTRAARIINTIVREAERRGWKPSYPKGPAKGRYRNGWSPAQDGHFTITAGELALRFRFQERGVHTRGPWETEVKQYRKVDTSSPWYEGRRIPTGEYDADATGELELAFDLDGYHPEFSGRQSGWGDRQSWRLEERLGYIFREIEERLIEWEWAKQQAEIAAERAAERARLEAEARRRQWEAHIELATQRLTDSVRVARLADEVDRWHRAEQIRTYCRALQASHGTQPETAEWINWAQDYARRIDPLTGKPPTLPSAPEPTPEQLQEFMPPGWSAEDPEGRDLRQHTHAPADDSGGFGRTEAPRPWWPGQKRY